MTDFEIAMSLKKVNRMSRTGVIHATVNRDDVFGNYGVEVLGFSPFSNPLSCRKLFGRYIRYAYSDQDWVPPPPPPPGKFRLDIVKKP